MFLMQYLENEFNSVSYCTDFKIRAILIDFLLNENKGKRFNTIKGYMNAILDFDFYLKFINKSWNRVIEQDLFLYSEILKKVDIERRGIKLRVNYVRSFLKYYESNKFKKKFL